MRDELKIREARSTDIPSLVTLVNSAYRGETGSRGWTSEAAFIGGQRIDKTLMSEILESEDQVLLIACQDVKIIGCVHLSKLNRGQQIESQLGLLTVDVDNQQQGIGEFLICAAEEFARKELKSITMRMSVISIRKELIAYYERRGYRATGEVAPFPYGQERFGLPKRSDLEFQIYTKSLLGAS
jgi:predicted N-acetyltransferase YhbS